MNWDDVRIFLAVARAGQILGASRRLGVNHATVARRLSALEASLKVTLIMRRTNGCELTQAGEEFLAAAERMEAEMLAARALVGNADVALAGTVQDRRAGRVRHGLPGSAARRADGTLPRPDRPARAGAAVLFAVAARGRHRHRRRPATAGPARRAQARRLHARASCRPRLSRPRTARHRRRRISPAIGWWAMWRISVISPSLNYASEISREWKATFEVSSALGQVEAVRSGAGIGILHSFIARQHPNLVPVLPERHDPARLLARLSRVRCARCRASRRSRSSSRKTSRRSASISHEGAAAAFHAVRAIGCCHRNIMQTSSGLHSSVMPLG